MRTEQQYKDLTVKEFTKAAEIYESGHAGIYEMCKDDYPYIYEELEREGYIYTVPAKGCFVAGLNPALLREEHLRQLEEKLAEAAVLARRCALSEDDVREMLHDAMEELV